MTEVTICMPFFNRQEMVLEAFHSVLNQTYPSWRLLLYNDGSTDEAERVLIDAYLELPKGQRRKIEFAADTRNRGQGFARLWFAENIDTELATWLDSDDRLHPESIQARLDRMEQTGADVVCSHIQRLNPLGVVMPGAIRKINVNAMRLGVSLMRSVNNNTNTATCLFNAKARSCIRPPVINHGNWDGLWHARMIYARCQFAYVPKPLYYCRQHGGRIVARARKTPAWTREQELIKAEYEKMGFTLDPVGKVPHGKAV